MHVRDGLWRQTSATLPATFSERFSVGGRYRGGLELRERDGAEQRDNIFAGKLRISGVGLWGYLRPHMIKPAVKELRQRGLTRLQIGATSNSGNQAGAFDLRLSLGALE
jgi:hypothetical protein